MWSVHIWISICSVVVPSYSVHWWHIVSGTCAQPVYGIYPAIIVICSIGFPKPHPFLCCFWCPSTIAFCLQQRPDSLGLFSFIVSLRFWCIGVPDKFLNLANDFVRYLRVRRDAPASIEGEYHPPVTVHLFYPAQWKTEHGFNWQIAKQFIKNFSLSLWYSM